MTRDVNHPMPDTLLMGLDLGTSVVKGVVMDAVGHELATVSRATVYDHPQAHWVETDPAAYLDAVFGLIRELTQHAPGPIRALAFSGASGNTLLCDGAGHPLIPIINWMDGRAEEDVLSVLSELTVEEVRQVTGWPCINCFPLGHLAWLRDHESALYRRAERVCMNTDWLLFQLTGEWVMDHSTATTFHLQDQVAGCYHPPFLDMLALSREQLSRLTGSGVAVGTVPPGAAERTGLSADTLVVTGCFDHPAAARAVGVLAPGQLLLSCGTSWVGFFPETNRQKLIDAALLCDPFLSGRGVAQRSGAQTDGPWGGMFSIPQIGRTIDQYIKQLIAPGTDDPYAVFNAAAAECTEPDWTVDLREPVRAPEGVSRRQLARAVMVSAARLLNEQLDVQRANGFCFEEAVLVGGPSRSPVWPGVIEQITGLRLVTGTSHCGARGAAMLAGIGAGVYVDERDAFGRAGQIRVHHDPQRRGKR